MEMLSELAPVDLGALGLIALNLLIGLMRGFAHQLTRLIVVIGSMALGRAFAGELAPLIEPHLSGSQAGAEVVAYFAIIIGVVLVGWLIGYLLRNIIKSLKLESFDHLLGMLLGGFKGVAFVLIGVLLASQWASVPLIHDSLSGTESLRFTQIVVTHLEPVFPPALKDKFDAVTHGFETPSGATPTGK